VLLIYNLPEMDLLFTLLIVFFLVLLSAICSGLNIGLMALDLNDLRRKSQIGNKAAARVLPYRRRTHLSLASILLSNVAVISTTSLVLEHRFNGIIAGIASTLLIVIFGEVLPQAVFAKSPLKATSYFVPLLQLMLVLSYPIAKPLQLLLDKIVGHPPRKLPSRQELGMIITEQLGAPSSELDDDEITIINGALRLSLKQVRDILTPIDKVYFLQRDTELNPEKIDELKQKGFSRIPIFDSKRSKCYGVLLLKDLVDVNLDDQLLHASDLPMHPVDVIGPMTALDTTFRIFLKSRAHLIAVERNDKIIGIVTIEDLIEEILGQEIEDEKDRRQAKNQISAPAELN
jgi:metal transporter CNNM